MAADSKKGFSVSNPGAKEYLIVGGVALAAALAYLYFKNRSSAAPASSGTASAPRASTPTGMSTHDLRIWIMDHASSPKQHKPPDKKAPVGPAK